MMRFSFLGELSVDQVKNLKSGTMLYLSDEVLKFKAIPEDVIVHLGVGIDVVDITSLKHIKVFQVDSETPAHLIRQIPKNALLQITSPLKTQQITSIRARHILLCSKRLKESDFLRFSDHAHIVKIDLAQSLNEKTKKIYSELIDKHKGKNKREANSRKTLHLKLPSVSYAKDVSKSKTPQDGDLSMSVESKAKEREINSDTDLESLSGIGMDAKSEDNLNLATLAYVAELEQTLQEARENLSQKNLDFEKLQEDMSAELASKVSCITTLDGNIKELSAFVDRLKEEVRHMQEARTVNNDELVSLRERIQILENKLLEESAKKDAVTQERDELEAKIIDLERVKKTNDDLQQIIANKDDEIKNFEARISQLEKVSEEDKKKITELTAAEITPLEKDIEYLFDYAFPEKNSEIESLKQKVEILKADLEKMTHLAQFNGSRLIELENENGVLIAELRKYQNCESALYQLQEESRVRGEALKLKTQFCVSLAIQCREYLKEIEKLKKEINGLQSKDDTFSFRLFNS